MIVFIFMVHHWPWPPVKNKIVKNYNAVYLFQNIGILQATTLAISRESAGLPSWKMKLSLQIIGSTHCKNIKIQNVMCVILFHAFWVYIIWKQKKIWSYLRHNIIQCIKQKFIGFVSHIKMQRGIFISSLTSTEY